MSILPSFLSEAVLKEAEGTALVLGVPKEYGLNFNTGQLTGAVVEGREAIKVWIWNTLHTERFRHAIYSWDYGVEFDQYIGETITDEYLQSDCETEVEDALLVSPYISGISNFEAELVGDKLHISFTADTNLGSVEVDTNV